MYTFSVSNNTVYVTYGSSGLTTIQGLATIAVSKTPVPGQVDQISIYNQGKLLLNVRTDYIQSIGGASPAGTTLGIVQQINALFILAYPSGGGGGGGSTNTTIPISFTVGDPGAPTSGSTSYTDATFQSNLNNGFTAYIFRNGYGYLTEGVDYDIKAANAGFDLINGQEFFDQELYVITFFKA
jgi:hypothetical protein